MAYGARLESGLGASPQGFESPILRRVMSQDIGDTLEPLGRVLAGFADASGLVVDVWVED